MSGEQGETGAGGGKGTDARARRERRPSPDEYADFYAGYVNAVPDGDVVRTLERHGAELEALLRAVPEELESHRYADGKWNVREVAGHVVDSERLFSFRAVHIARGDPAPLPGIDQEVWARGSNAAHRPMVEIIDEWRAVRAATVALFRGLPAEAWERTGVASDAPVSVRALAWITAGHALHHHGVLVERYGLDAPGRTGKEGVVPASSSRDDRTGPSHRIPRRRDRSKDEAWIRAYLAEATWGFLAVPNGDGPPHLNGNLFVFDEDEGCLYLHTARTGRLRELMEGARQVSFSASAMGRLLPADEALEFSVEYAGVVVTGVGRVVEDEAEAARALQALLDRYAPHLRAGEDYRPPVPEELARTAVYRIDPVSWSGKEKWVEEGFPGAFEVPAPGIPFLPSGE